MVVLDDFCGAHARLEAELKVADAAVAEAPKLLAQLKGMRRAVVTHFAQKDAFYVALAKQCDAAKDAGAAQLTRIFESNMKMQSAAVVRFFETLDGVPADSLPASYRTMATIIRQRFSTEEKAVFPLYKRTAPRLEEARP